jgi:hypothetical protein
VKPAVNVSCTAALYDYEHERTLEFSFPSALDIAGKPTGGLLGLSIVTGVPTVTVYRLDSGVRVVVQCDAQLVQDGKDGRVVEHSDLLDLLVAAVFATRTSGLDDNALRHTVQRYTCDLRGQDRATMHRALSGVLALRCAQGVHPDAPGYAEWRTLLAELE